MLAVLPTLLTLLLMTSVDVHHAQHRREKIVLNGFSLISLVVAGYLMMVIIWENLQPVQPLTRIFIFFLLLTLLASPAYIAIKGASQEPAQDPEALIDERSRLIEEDDRLDPGATGEYETIQVCDKTPARVPVASGPPTCGERIYMRDNDLTLLQAMRTVNFWLMFLAMACGMGSGLATVNNIGQIGHSLGYTSKETSTLVSLWSIWNFLGRFGAGYISDYFLQTRGYARPLFISITLAIMSVGHVVISSGIPGALYIGSIFVGLCYGCQWSLAPIITSEIFGLRHMGTVFNMISLASPLGSYILSVKVVGYLFDMKVGRLSDLRACTNSHCFMISFLVMGAVSFSGSILSLVLFFRTRRFYERVIFPRLQSLKRDSI